LNIDNIVDPHGPKTQYVEFNSILPINATHEEIEGIHGDVKDPTDTGCKRNTLQDLTRKNNFDGTTNLLVAFKPYVFDPITLTSKKIDVRFNDFDQDNICFGGTLFFIYSL
jgi:hypothetical protein